LSAISGGGVPAIGCGLGLAFPAAAPVNTQISTVSNRHGIVETDLYWLLFCRCCWSFLKLLLLVVPVAIPMYAGVRANDVSNAILSMSIGSKQLLYVGDYSSYSPIVVLLPHLKKIIIFRMHEKFIIQHEMIF
jgi:hypothetical protein